MGWSNWDVRLAKIVRSLYLFEQKDYMESMQVFARDLMQNEKKGRGFFYDEICLDELLHFSLPRDQYPLEEQYKGRPKVPKSVVLPDLADCGHTIVPAETMVGALFLGPKECCDAQALPTLREKGVTGIV